MIPNWARSTAGLLSASSCHRGHVLHVGEAKLAYFVAWSQEGPKDKRVTVPAMFSVICWVSFSAGGCRQSTECRRCSLAGSSTGCARSQPTAAANHHPSSTLGWAGTALLAGRLMSQQRSDIPACSGGLELDDP